MGSFIHVATPTGWSSSCVLISSINGSMKGGLVHLFVRMIRTEVANSTSIWISCLIQREPMGGVATITPFLDTVTALTEGGSDFLRNAKILSLNPHPIKPYRMPAILKFFQLLRVALTSFFRENHALL